MARQAIILAALAVLTLGAVDVGAHERFRVVGTITRRQPSVIEVQTQAGKKVWIAMSKQTVVTRDKTKVPAAELKTGRSVVVDAIGDDYTDLVAQAVRLVPAIGPPAAKAPALVPFRIVGIITTRQATQMDVKTTDGRRIYIELTKTTIVLRDKTRVPVTALTPGLSVVVDALGNDESDLTANQVRIVPATAPAPGKGKAG